MKGDFFEFLFFAIVIGITIVGRIIKAQAEKSGNSKENDPWATSTADADGGWEDWQPQAVAQPNISKYQQELMALERKKREQEQTRQPSPVEVVQESQSSDFYEGETTAYEFEQPAPTPYHASESGFADSTSPGADIEVDEEALRQMREAMANAFPRARRMTRRASGKDRVIRITIRGRSDLRRAVLLNEVLGQPRAFDL